MLPRTDRVRVSNLQNLIRPPSAQGIWYQSVDGPIATTDYLPARAEAMATP